MVNIHNIFLRMQELGINAKKVSENTGISSGNLSDWKNGRSLPSAVNLSALADYLDCSIDYLLGRTDIKKEQPLSYSDLTESEKTEADRLAALSEEELKKIMDYVDFIISQRDK